MDDFTQNLIVEYLEAGEPEWSPWVTVDLLHQHLLARIGATKVAVESELSVLMGQEVVDTKLDPNIGEMVGLRSFTEPHEATYSRAKAETLESYQRRGFTTKWVAGIGWTATSPSGIVERFQIHT